ncbi:hypothetical protein BCEN4_740015 [Burkholderia cenocepacia]|nr:hypothetical protein BCEN4_740015 [Burkholderia cenocepacia]
MLISIFKCRYSFFEIIARIAITHLTYSTTSTTTKPLIKLTIQSRVHNSSDWAIWMLRFKVTDILQEILSMF